MALTALGGTALNAGDLDAAERYSRDALSGAQEIGEALMSCISLVNLSHVAAARGERTALQLFRNTIALSLEAEAPGTVYESLLGIASLAGDIAPLNGVRWLATAEAWRKTYIFSDVEEPYVGALRKQTGARLRMLVDKAAFDAAYAEGEAMTLAAAAGQATDWVLEVTYRL
jgi:hypothetical protein